MNAVIVSYYQTSAFKNGLAENSQKMRRAILERFREEHGDKRIALMHKKALQTILDKKSPAAAANWRKALRGLIDHALSLDMLATDPLAGVKLTPVKSNGHHTWEPEECARYEAHYALGTRERLAYELLLQIGHSRCDIVRMGRQHVRNGVLSLQRQKTKVAFDVTVMPMLQAAIDAMPPNNHMMFLLNEVQQKHHVIIWWHGIDSGLQHRRRRWRRTQPWFLSFAATARTYETCWRNPFERCRSGNVRSAKATRKPAAARVPKA